MGSSDDPSRSRISPFRLFSFASTFDTLEKIIFVGIGGAILGFFAGLTDLIQAIFNFFSQPIFAGGQGATDIVLAFLGGIATVIQTGARVTAFSLFPGQSSLVVPLFAFVYAVAIVGVVAFVMATFLRRVATSDFVPGTATDFPGVGADEEEDSD